MDMHRAHPIHFPLAYADRGVGLKRDSGNTGLRTYALVGLLVAAAVERPWQADKQVLAEAW